jgi:hypothetical protein
MISNALFFTLVVGVAAFVSWRLWVSVAARRVDVRGWLFERSDQPARYWTHIVLNAVAAVLLIGLLAILALGFWNA